MENVVRRTVVVALTVHGLIHLLGVAKGFGWADVPQLKAPIGTRSGLLWSPLRLRWSPRSPS